MHVFKCKNLLWLRFICHDIIYFLHNSAFQAPAAMCTAGHILVGNLLGEW